MILYSFIYRHTRGRRASGQEYVYRRVQKNKPRAMLRITSKVNANSSILVHCNVTYLWHAQVTKITANWITQLRILLSNMQIPWSTEVGYPIFMNYCFKRGSCPSNIQPSQYTDVLCWLIGFTKQTLHRQSPCFSIKYGKIRFSANFGYLSTSYL